MNKVTTAAVLATLFFYPAVVRAQDNKRDTTSILPADRTSTTKNGTAPARPQPDGPKKRIAVTKFDAVGGFVAQVGGSDIGGGLAAQLITALTATGRFVVVERADLPAVLHEQELGMTGLASRETAPQAGQLVGAQILVRGSVTDFDQSTGGKGGQFGLSVAGATLGLGRSTVTGHVGIDLRFIDAMTGEILDSRRAEARVTERGSNASLAVGGLSFGGNGFEKTALGQASREAIAQAVEAITARMARVAWSASVVEVADSQVYINAGNEMNVAPGQHLMISSVAKELIDPATGLKLGAVERPLGEVVVETVLEKYSVARQLSAMRAARGDIVRLVTEAAANATLAPAPKQPGHPSLEALRQTAQEYETLFSTTGSFAMPMGALNGSVVLNGMPTGGLSNGVTVSPLGTTPLIGVPSSTYELALPTAGAPPSITVPSVK